MSARKSSPPSVATHDAVGGKLPGKTKFSGRRRNATRTSGHHSHPGATGGDYVTDQLPAYSVHSGDQLELLFSLPETPSGSLIGYGGWFTADAEIKVSVGGRGAPARNTLVVARAPNWGKVGSMWRSDGQPVEVIVSITSEADGRIAFWGLDCGHVEHEYLTNARPVLLENMFTFAPEANFYCERGTVTVRKQSGLLRVAEPSHLAITRKQCNRCARFLPINVDNERLALSFSNHCVADHRRPCHHTGFGKLRNATTKAVIHLEYGYQLECRFCKKFAVNAPHNVQRSSAQMKEDSARRRSIEQLLAKLYPGSAQLRYRHEHGGTELADAVWERFGKRCFNCGEALPTAKSMRLDHTRPLALLWPLDGSATALCNSCNSKKRDRAPSDFYTGSQLKALAKVTGVPLSELRDPSPNLVAVRLLRKRLDWFFDTFLTSPELVKVRDGKTAAELLVKALQKTINKCPQACRIDLSSELACRRSRSSISD